jgi:hypothetical protein
MFGVSYPGLRFDEGCFLMPATTPTQFDPGLYKASVHALAEAEPRFFYLTHYSALPYAPEQVGRLCRQLDAYAAIAEETDSDTQSRVRSVTSGELTRLVGRERASEAVATLAADIQLNSSGIDWYRRTLQR